MMCKGSTKPWSAFGAVLILTAALSNSSCCSHRKVVDQARTETTEHAATSTQIESRSEGKQDATLTRETESRGVTVTEIEVYDTGKPPLSELVFHLGTQPVKFDPVFVALQLTAYPCPDRGSYRRRKRRYYDCNYFAAHSCGYC